ncbi:MAG: S8 family peptidase, partial [Gaiellaceae bacterium]
SPVRIVVGYQSSRGPAAATLERLLGTEPVTAIPKLDVHVVSVPPYRVEAVLAALRSSPLVRYAERDVLVRAFRVPNDEFWRTEWSPRKTNAPEAWSVTIGSPNIVVSVVDTGVDPAQPDLSGKLVPGYDFVNGRSDVLDDNGHGTAVAAIIGANSDNHIGVASYCWECRIMPVKVLGADGTGFSSTLAQGIIWATDHGADVINASLGGPDLDSALSAAAQYAWQHGVLLVAAAGNDSSSTVDFPAALPNVLSVGASDQNDRLYDFSNSGAAVAAPGENSTIARDGGYELFLGTSSAAPVVSGIAALELSAKPDASPAQLTQALEQSATPIAGVTFGRVDAYAALHALVSGLPSAPTGPSTQAGTGSAAAVTRVFKSRLSPRRRRTFSIVPGAGLLRATLVLRSPAPRPVVLELRRGTRLIAIAQGRQSLQMQARVDRASYRIVISATGARSRFTLTVTYARPS